MQTAVAGPVVHVHSSTELIISFTVNVSLPSPSLYV